MLNDTYPLYLANKAQSPNTNLAVTNKYTGEIATRVALADPATIDRAIAAAATAAPACRKMPSYQRATILRHVAERIAAQGGVGQPGAGHAGHHHGSEQTAGHREIKQARHRCRRRLETWVEH